MKHSSAIIEIPCDRIRIGERHRKDMGDLDGLAVSIATVGLLHPPVVTEDGLLVCGERRFLAMRDILRWTTIPVIVLQVSSIVESEYAENEIRKDFTLSERVAIGRALEAEVGNRQGQRTDRQPQDNCPEVTAGTQTRELAASKAGFDSYKTYERAKKVVEKAVDEVVAQMDAGELSVSAAAVIAEQPPEQQRAIARMDPAQQKEAVRQIRTRKAALTPPADRPADPGKQGPASPPSGRTTRSQRIDRLARLNLTFIHATKHLVHLLHWLGETAGQFEEAEQLLSEVTRALTAVTTEIERKAVAADPLNATRLGILENPS